MLLELKIKLNKFSEKHNLLEKTFQYCKDNIQSCLVEEKELGIIPLNGTSHENIRIKFHSQFLLNNREYLYTPCFTTRLNIYDNEDKTEDFNEMQYIGYYDLDVDENGIIFDDWLNFI